MSLHDLLDDVARTAPPADALRSADEAWGTAGRRRRRSRVVAGAAVVGLVVVAVLVGTSIIRTAPKPLPGNGELSPGQGIPAHIYGVKPWLPTIGGKPIPPMAYVYVATGRTKVISVDGSYRYFPRTPKGSGLYTAFGSISPGGRYLAYVEHVAEPDPTGSLRAEVQVFDSTTGHTSLVAEVSRSDLSPYGLTWSPDATHLAWLEGVDSASGGSIAGSVVIAGLDGGREVLQGLEGGVAWSPDGTRLLATQSDGGAVITDLKGKVFVHLDVPDNTWFWPNSWSPDGRRVAGMSCVQNSESGGLITFQTNCLGDPTPTLEIASASNGSATSTTLGYANMQIDGWRGGVPLLGGPLAVDSPTLDFAIAPTDPESGKRPSGPLVTTADSSLGFQVLFQAPGDLLASAPIVEFPAPSQPVLSWTFVAWAMGEWGVWITACLSVVLGLVVVAAWSRRRRRTAVR